MIPFVRNDNIEYGVAKRLSPLVTRVTAQNPGPFTYTGTGVFIVGTDEVCIIDPGPILAPHRQALEAALVGKTVSHILVTHHHADHSPLARPLADHYGCQVHGFGIQPRPPEGGEVRMEAGDDLTFKPDIEIKTGQIFNGKDWALESIHTPGHTSNHMCFALHQENTLFSGDHIMGWSTSIVSPPDGNMGDYLRALNDIRKRKFSTIRPTHGPAITDVDVFLNAYIGHRLQREIQIKAALKSGLRDILSIVKSLYTDIDKRLYPAASLSVLSHLIHMHENNEIGHEGELGLKAKYWLQ